MNSDPHKLIVYPKWRKRRRVRQLILLTLLVAAVALLAYLAIAGRTSSWPETSCSIANSRVVRADRAIGSYRSVVVLYRGELQLRYTVRGREYFIWADSGWVDQDQGFVEDKMASAIEGRCEYNIRYNPRNPAEAVAVPK